MKKVIRLGMLSASVVLFLMALLMSLVLPDYKSPSTGNVVVDSVYLPISVLAVGFLWLGGILQAIDFWVAGE